MDYELYHDESKLDGYWHGMLLVPVATKPLLLKYLTAIREQTAYANPLGLKNVKQEGRVLSCAEAWVQFAAGAMISTPHAGDYKILYGKGPNHKLTFCSYSQEVRYPIQAKFILFRDRDAMRRMTNALDHGAKVETVARMGMKGGLHFLGSPDHPINIVKMHFDGYEHYLRSLDQDRLILRISGLRDYCSFAKEINFIIDDRTSNHTRPDCQPYDDCQLLQLADLLVGSFRVGLGYQTNDKGLHGRVAQPVKYLIEKYNRGYARMQNSRWRDSLCMSQCYLENGQWIFEPVELSPTKSHPQPSLFE